MYYISSKNSNQQTNSHKLKEDRYTTTNDYQCQIPDKNNIVFYYCIFVICYQGTQSSQLPNIHSLSAEITSANTFAFNKLTASGGLPAVWSSLDKNMRMLR